MSTHQIDSVEQLKNGKNHPDNKQDEPVRHNSFHCHVKVLVSVKRLQEVGMANVKDFGIQLFITVGYAYIFTKRS